MKSTSKLYESLANITDNDFHLCFLKESYISDHVVLWFANCEATLVWGDDWNDAPFEHNAGVPYFDNGRFYKTVIIPKEYITDLIMDKTVNTRWSVEKLNEEQAFLFNIGNIAIHANDNLDKVNKALLKIK